MKNPTRLMTAIAIITSTFVFSCEKSSKNELSDAQLCLNTATADSALGCVSKISSNTEPLAYSLRCTAIFISQGFGDAASFVDALDSINAPASCTSCSSTVNALDALKFSQGDLTDPAVRLANNNMAADAFSQCSQADAKIYTQIASLFRIGTMTSMLLAVSYPSGGYTPDQLAAELGNLAPADIGALVNVTYVNTCSDTENASDSTQTYCTDLANAIAQSDGTEAGIGACLIAKLQNPAAVCP